MFYFSGTFQKILKWILADSLVQQIMDIDKYDGEDESVKFFYHLTFCSITIHFICVQISWLIDTVLLIILLPGFYETQKMLYRDFLQVLLKTLSIFSLAEIYATRARLLEILVSIHFPRSCSININSILYFYVNLSF